MSKRIQLSNKELKTAGTRLASMQNRIKKIKESTEKTVEKVIRTGEVTAGAFGVGVMNGKTGGVELMGVPVELGAGLALNVLSYMGAAGKASDHLGNVGDGFLAGYAALEGFNIGNEWKSKSEGGQSALPARETPAITSGEVRLTPEEIAHAAAMGANVGR